MPSSMTEPRSSLRGMDVEMHGHTSTHNKAKSWTESRPVSRHLDEPPTFCTPTYLQNSRYIQRLKQAYEAQLVEWRELSLVSSSNTSLLSKSSSHVNLSRSQMHRPPHADATERRPVTAEDRALPGLPSRWNEEDRVTGLDVLGEGLEIRLTGVAKSSDDAASIRSDLPIPKECGIFYYEVTVMSRSKDGLIGVGFSARKANLSRLPGWENDSWAYHGDDGNSFACSSNGKAYGPKFSSQDVVGCGINFRTASAFFTRNGVNLGTAFTNIKTEQLYPSVGLKKPGEHVRVNFGRTPFVFDIDAMVERERDMVLREIASTDSSSLHDSEDEDTFIQRLVSQYLAHEGYVDTAKAFGKDLHEQRQSVRDLSSLGLPTSEDDVHAINRQKIRKTILDGDIDRALKYISTYYPRVLDNDRNRDIYFRLRCRKFIEMMRRYSIMSTSHTPAKSVRTSSRPAGKDIVMDELRSHIGAQTELDDQLSREVIGRADSSYNTDIDMEASVELSGKSPFMKLGDILEVALDYGRQLQHEFGGDPRPHIQKQLQDLFAIIAYTDPAESPIEALLDPQRRVQIAEDVNGAILTSLGKPSSAAIEKLCAQTEYFIDSVAAKSGGAAALINLRNDLLNTPREL